MKKRSAALTSIFLASVVMAVVAICSSTAALAAQYAKPSKAGSQGSLFGMGAATLSAGKLDRWVAVKGKHQAEIGSSEWRSLVAKVRSRSQANLLQRVNEQVNLVRYVADSQDRWLSPTEFVRRGGDCEDYAIAKYLLLKSLGVSSSSMRIVALAARPGIAAHSVLVVDSPRGPMVLDNHRREIYPLGRAQTSRTVYAFNDSSWWIPVSAFGTVATSR